MILQYYLAADGLFENPYRFSVIHEKKFGITQKSKMMMFSIILTLMASVFSGSLMASGGGGWKHPSKISGTTKGTTKMLSYTSRHEIKKIDIIKIPDF